MTEKWTPESLGKALVEKITTPCEVCGFIELYCGPKKAAPCMDFGALLKKLNEVEE